MASAAPLGSPVPLTRRHNHSSFDCGSEPLNTYLKQFAWVDQRAGTANPSTAGDVEYGRDTKLSSVQAVADAIGLRLELVEI